MNKRNIRLASLGIVLLILNILLIARYYFGPYHSFPSVNTSHMVSHLKIAIDSQPSPIPASWLVESFEQQDCLLFWGADHCRRERSNWYATEGKHSLKVIFHPAEYSSIDTFRLPRNWSYSTTFTLDIFNPQNDTYWFTVRIDDHDSRNYQTRFNQEYKLIPGKNQLVIGIEEMRQKINIKDVTDMVLFLSNLSQPATLYIDNLRLN
jgi:hypothetical protein